MPANAHIYKPSRKKIGPLRQGEILTNVIQLEVAVKDVRKTNDYDFDTVIHDYAIVVSQDCDLDWDFKARQSPQPDPIKKMMSVLFCQMYDFSKLSKNMQGNAKQNKNERYQFLRECLPEEDTYEEVLPPLVVDFKNYFSMPTEEIYARIKISQALRRCRLVSPYLEHFATRFTYFQSRVALPEEHYKQPQPTG